MLNECPQPGQDLFSRVIEKDARTPDGKRRQQRAQTPVLGDDEECANAIERALSVKFCFMAYLHYRG
jgi:hypothetical protein